MNHSKKFSLKEFFRMRESDKHFLLALLAVTGVIFFWRGGWGIIDLIPILSNPFMSLFVGLVIMTFSGVIYREFIPEEESITPVIDIINEAFKKAAKKRNVYVVKYYDEVAGHHKEIRHSKIKKIEHNFLVTEKNGEEFFIPIHRVHEISIEGRVVWRRGKELNAPEMRTV